MLKVVSQLFLDVSNKMPTHFEVYNVSHTFSGCGSTNDAVGGGGACDCGCGSGSGCIATSSLFFSWCACVHIYLYIVLYVHIGPAQLIKVYSSLHTDIETQRDRYVIKKRAQVFIGISFRTVFWLSLFAVVLVIWSCHWRAGHRIARKWTELYRRLAWHGLVAVRSP